MRGYVIAVDDTQPERPLREIAARSGRQGAFTSAMLPSLRWAATHYIAPLSTVLGRSAPPNLPKGAPGPRTTRLPGAGGVLAEWGTRQIEQGRRRTGYLLTGDPLEAAMSAITPIVAAGSNVIVTAPTVVEARETGAALQAAYGARVHMATSDESAAVRTTAWGRLSAPTGAIVVGTREVAFWGKEGLGLVVVLDEGRRAYKSPRTPTLHVRDVFRRRALIERFGLLLTGSVPTTEAMAGGVEIFRFAHRIWSHVDIDDRSGRDFGSGMIGDRTLQALTALGPTGTAFVLVPRRGGTFRCARCRELRKCPGCGAMLDRAGYCARCDQTTPACTACGGRRFEGLGGGVTRIVDDLSRVFRGSVGPAADGYRIGVGTERDLVGLDPVDLAVVVDPDGGILAPNYRAGEDALRLLARTVLAAKPGRGRRALVQTSLPDHPVMSTLRTGDPIPFLQDVLRERAATGFPPVGELIAVESDDPDATPVLAEAAGDGVLLGPAPEGDRYRWLIQGPDLSRVRIRLRSAVQRLRDGGSSVRVDADPVDL